MGPAAGKLQLLDALVFVHQVDKGTHSATQMVPYSLYIGAMALVKASAIGNRIIPILDTATCRKAFYFLLVSLPQSPTPQLSNDSRLSVFNKPVCSSVAISDITKYLAYLAFN